MGSIPESLTNSGPKAKKMLPATTAKKPEKIKEPARVGRFVSMIALDKLPMEIIEAKK
jgi:hypothetical protein